MDALRRLSLPVRKCDKIHLILYVIDSSIRRNRIGESLLYGQFSLEEERGRIEFSPGIN